MKTTEKGNIGENIACEYLEKSGYIIKDRNFRSKHGEIDIIAENDSFLVFVEIKTRNESNVIRFARPCKAVTKTKQNSIAFTAEIYLLSHPTKKSLRFDIIEIYESPERYGLKHLRSAFAPKIY